MTLVTQPARLALSTVDARIDEMIAAALRGEDVPSIAGDSIAMVMERIRYHGVAGLLSAPGMQSGQWPDEIANSIREAALAEAMWELRHRQLLATVLAAMTEKGIASVLLKGTAIAYDLYSSPATRSRGDSDLLIHPQDLDRARRVLRDHGMRLLSGEDFGDSSFKLQETWAIDVDGNSAHHLDLHWQSLNTPALARVLPLAQCLAEPRPLPRLSQGAFAMDRVAMLIHACVHRSLHFTSPYFVDGRQYHGGDRLIWLYDIHLLAGALDDGQWSRFVAVAREQRVAALCLDGLSAAGLRFGMRVPPSTRERLAQSARASHPPLYLRSRQLGRAWAELTTISGLRRKLAFIQHRVLPSPSFMRGKYPRLAALPLPMLYARRMIDLLRPRRERTGR